MLLDIERLREVMAHRGFTVKGLARTAKVSACSLNLWLNHNGQPRLDTLGRVVKVLDIPINQIVKEW